jgi:hypothetical protein
MAGDDIPVRILVGLISTGGDADHENATRCATAQFMDIKARGALVGDMHTVAVPFTWTKTFSGWSSLTMMFFVRMGSTICALPPVSWPTHSLEEHFGGFPRAPFGSGSFTTVLTAPADDL